jgi:hypothetical protein
MDVESIIQLAKVFSGKGIYSKNRYDSFDCPLQVFKRLYPVDSYSSEIDSLLDCCKNFAVNKSKHLFNK